MIGHTDKKYPPPPPPDDDDDNDVFVLVLFLSSLLSPFPFSVFDIVAVAKDYSQQLFTKKEKTCAHACESVNVSRDLLWRDTIGNSAL